jgi:GNAT superfamily N-acetyltransferase
VDICEAKSNDNDELQALQTRCPQGTNLIVSVVNTPDFFARSKAFELYKVFIAREGKHILGSAACGLKNVFVSGKVRRVGYGFQAFISPEHRRKGIAGMLHRHREDYAVQHGAALFYTLVLENNIPAMRYIKRQGFQLHRDLVMSGLAVFREMTTTSDGLVRSALPQDLAALAELLNETWKGFELYGSASAQGLSQFICRTPGYDLNNLLVLQDNDHILACLGYWDLRKIKRTSVDALSLKIRMIGLLIRAAGIFVQMPRPLKPGDTLKQCIVTPIGFKDVTHFSTLLRHLNNHVLQIGIEQIFLICERDHEMLKAMRGFIRINTTTSLYVKPLRERGLMADKSIYIDGIDM